MEKIEILAGTNLDETVEMLLKMKKQGKSVYCEFNGHKLYSDNVTIDSAYLEVLGTTKEEWVKKRQEWLESLRKKEEQVKNDATKKIPHWIEKGEKYIYPQKLDDWKRCVKTRAKDIYNGLELDSALEAMEALNKGMSFEKVNEIIDGKGHSGKSHSLVMDILIYFSKNGPEFYETISPNKTEEMRYYVDKQKELNLKFEEELNDEALKL